MTPNDHFLCGFVIKDDGCFFQGAFILNKGGGRELVRHFVLGSGRGVGSRTPAQ